MTLRLLLTLVVAGGLLAGCGGSDDPTPTSTPTDTPPAATITAAGSDVPRSVPPTLVPASVILTVSRQSIGTDAAEKLTLPVSKVEDIVGTLDYRTIFDCKYMGFLASPGAALVSPVDGVVIRKYEVSARDPLTGNTGGLAIAIAMPSGSTVDMYFGGGSTSDLVVGDAVTRGQAIGFHSGKEMNSFSLGFNTLMLRSGKSCAVMSQPEEWVGGSPSVLAP